MKQLVTDSSGSVRVEDAPLTSEHPIVESTRAQKIAAYVALTKPRIIELLLVTTVPSMIVAARGFPRMSLVLWTLLGGTLSAGGANAINCFIDRDIDEVMPRTRKRPLPQHRIAPARALLFGVILGVIAFAQLWATVNLMSALLATAALLFYVFVYTIGMKRSTPQNIVIGGAAGAVPALVGWSAVTGTVELPAVVLFGIIFYWTPPHFWALAIRYKDDYAAADVPMLPVVASLRTVGVRILLYTLVLWGLTIAFSPVAGMGNLYLGVAIVSGALFTWFSIQVIRIPTPASAMRLFGYSITYITVLFAAMAADELLRSGL